MNIVTIMNYDFKDQHDINMCAMWAHSVVKSTDRKANVVVLSEKRLPEQLLEFMKTLNINCETCKASDDKNMHHNMRFKLFNLAHLDYPFIFLDADIFVMGKLDFLWERRNDKPWIGIDHQLNIPGHTSSRKFLNSGVQIVGDNKFYDLKNIIKASEEVDYKYEVPGKDQAALWTYFKKIGYDYTHEDIGPEWNACAGYTKLEMDNLCYWHGICELGKPYPVFINHYWHNFKPWKIDCPAYEWYKKYCPVRISSNG